MNDYEKFIAISRYARWVPDEGRRETWEETVDRYMGKIVSDHIDDPKLFDEIREAILSRSVMPSMRSMMTAGKAAQRDNTCMYNCSYLPVDDLKSFDEAMFILLCGTGVGFSVERQSITKLPEIPDNMFDSDTVVVVKDSKEGWAKALRQVIALLFAGEIPKWDVSKVRPAGAKLKTFGGRASGPAPLEALFRFVIDTVVKAKGRKLSSIECHDIMCKIGEVVVVGGVRRSAMISLSNLSDDRMRHAKSGNFWETNAQRSLANNSVAYTEKPDMQTFMREWQSLVESGTGERGIFNRQASKAQAAKNGRRDPDHDFGTNPCSEIILQPNQFCNLSEVVVRAEDTIIDLERKVELATILGTIQATYTHFPYLRKVWQRNTEEERLLGVSLTGIMDNPLMTSANAGLEKTLEHLRSIAVATNDKWANDFGIPVAAAITCVKPSGTVSQLVDSASGIHTRHSQYYIRTVRADNNDPLTLFMHDQGVPNEPDVMKPQSTTVFSFPMRAPEGCVTRDDVTAIDQLNTWLVYQRHWCEHKPSITVSVKEDEWMEVGAFVYKHFDEMSGVSFLPHSDHIYEQAPYQECTEEQYMDAVEWFPANIDWAAFSGYEVEDNTVSMQTFSCTGDSCEVVDLT
jgi:ribonucleoside-triphosphate reductase